MPTLRITQAGQNVETAFEEHGQGRLAVIRPFSFALSSQDSEDIRRYLEDYRIYPAEPQARMAARIEQRRNTIGCELFRLALAGSGVWASVRDRLGETRVEVETEVRGAVTPWELLCDPETNLSLALHAQAFVRSHSQAALRPKPALQPAGKIRILLAIASSF